MDPITIGLGEKIIDILMPYVKKGAAQLAKDIGVPAVEKVENLLETLKARLSGDKEATDTLTHFEEKPELHKDVLKNILEEKLAQDKNLAEELERLLRKIKEISPNIDVYIKMTEGEDITGMRAKELKKGKAKVSMEIKKGKKGTGVDIERLDNWKSENDYYKRNLVCEAAVETCG